MKRLTLGALVLIASASPALAHLNPGEHGSFAAGLSHPIFGADHVLAMVAVGLWAGLLGGSALWATPLAFVGAMVAGFGLAVAGLPLPFVEPMILASVVAIGLMVALAVKAPAGAAAAFVGLFALAHGHAHGGEMGEAGALAYGAGFVAATAALHLVGIAVARIARHTLAARALGASTAAGGLLLAFA